MEISGVCFLLFVFFFGVFFLSSLNYQLIASVLMSHSSFLDCLSPNKRVPYIESLQISKWENPPEVLWLDTVRLLWNCCYPSGLLWPFCLDPDSSVFLPQTPALFPSMSCPHASFPLVILSSHTHLLHSKKISWGFFQMLLSLGEVPSKDPQNCPGFETHLESADLLTIITFPVFISLNWCFSLRSLQSLLFEARCQWFFQEFHHGLSQIQQEGWESLSCVPWREQIFSEV